MVENKIYLTVVLLSFLFSSAQTCPQSLNKKEEGISKEPGQWTSAKAYSRNVVGKRQLIQFDSLNNGQDESCLQNTDHVPKHLQMLRRNKLLQNNFNKLNTRSQYVQNKSNTPRFPGKQSTEYPHYGDPISCDTVFASWIAEYAGPIPSEDIAKKIVGDKHGNIYVAGISTIEMDGQVTDYQEKCATVKYDSSGNEQWEASISMYWVTGLHVDTSGNVYVSGGSWGTDIDFTIVKYNSSGTEEWIAHYNGEENGTDYVADLTLDDSGNVYVTGRSGSPDTKAVTIKYNPSGIQQWIVEHTATPGNYYYVTAIAVDDSGNVYITGTGETSSTQGDYTTIKYNAAGVEQWIVQYNGDDNLGDIATAMAIDDSGNLYITGWSYGLTTEEDIATVKYNSSGIEQWHARYNFAGNSSDYPAGIALDRFGNTYVTGYTLGYYGGYCYSTVKYNSSGQEQWIARYGFGEPSDITTDYDGNIYVTGFSRVSGTTYNYATLKYDSSGNLTWVAIYNGIVNETKSSAIFVDASGNVNITGSNIGDDTGNDFVTIKYNSSGVERCLVRYDGPRRSKDYAEDLVIDNSGNVYVTGSSANTEKNYDFATVKYNSYGVKQWIARFDGPEDANDYASALAVDIDGNVYVTGVSEGPGPYSDYVIVKYNALGEEQWVRSYNGPGNAWDEATDIAVDDSDYVYVTGASNGFATNDDYATLKYDALGNEQWIARFNGSANSVDHAVKLALDPLGNVYVTGNSQGLGTSFDYATVKYNHLGIEQWVVRYNGPVNYGDYANDLFIDQSGNVYVTGYSQGSGTGFDYATIKYNSSGDEQWIRRYNGSSSGYDEAKSIAVDVNGNIYITGCSQEQDTDYNYATIKYDPFGAEQWTARYNGTGNSGDYATALTTDIFGNVYVTGSSEGSGTDYDYATVMYNSSGIEQWITRYNGLGNGYDEPTDITLDSLGNIYITGTTSSALNQYTTIKYDQEALGYAVSEKWNLVSLPKYVTNPSRTSIFPSSLTPLFEYDGVYIQRESLVVGKGYWTKFQSDECISIAGDINLIDTIIVNEGWNLIGSLTEPILTNQITSDPPGLITSEFFGYRNGYMQTATILPGKGYWVKVNQNGKLILSTSGGFNSLNKIQIVPTDEQPPSPPNDYITETDTKPKIYALEHAYPNPFNPVTTIKYQLPVGSRVRLKVYNTLGQVVSILNDEVQPAGFMSITWDASTYASGIYFYKLEAMSVSDPSLTFMQVKKMLLIK